MSEDHSAIDWNKMDNLVPAIVQHVDSGEFLMLGYMSPEALEKTQNTGLVTFYSRSRQTLWTKGETSGNTMSLVSLSVDCDGDTLLVQARPSGPVCHTGTRTCFGDSPGPEIGFLGTLQAIIEDRASASPEESYTAKLLADGLKKTAQKVGEEGVETALAGVSEDDDALINEGADLVYHLGVLLKARGLTLGDVSRRLAERHRGD